MLPTIIGGIGALIIVANLLGAFRSGGSKMSGLAFALGVLLIAVALTMSRTPPMRVAALGYYQQEPPSCEKEDDRTANILIQSVLSGQTAGWAFVQSEGVIQISGNLAPYSEDVIALEKALKKWGWQEEPSTLSDTKTWKEPPGGFIKCPGRTGSTDRFAFPLLMLLVVAIIILLIRKLRGLKQLRQSGSTS